MNQDKYSTWIEWYVQRCGNNLLGRCKEATEEMAREFPELTIVAGHIEDARWGRRAHYWLELDGKVIDPTAGQFPCLLSYEAWEPGGEVCVGICMDCGGHIYECVDSLDSPVQSRTFCNEICEKRTLDYLNSPERL